MTNVTGIALSRRGFIRVAAVGAGLSVAGSRFASARSSHYQTPIIWRGIALGAEAQIQLYHDDPAFAASEIDRCQREITRLENLFSLYRDSSEISRLNATGILKDPSVDMIVLLSTAKSFSTLTKGAFDVTIQPLWQLYADHFSKTTPDPAGPSEGDIAHTLDLVGSDKIDISATEIRFSRSGMGISLNGIAQGFITERVSTMLRNVGFENVLVHVGESQALGGHPDGRPWKVGIPVPGPASGDNGDLMTTIPLHDQALATSGGYGSPLSSDGKHHHLLDPRNGRSANLHQSVSVIAPGATDADMLSTAISILPIDQAAALLEKFVETRAIILTNDERVIKL